jgi:hypothetical protein
LSIMIRVRLAAMINVNVPFYAIVIGSKNSPLVKKKSSNRVLTYGIFENIPHRLMEVSCRYHVNPRMR